PSQKIEPVEYAREVTRTPSPTPTEAEVLRRKVRTCRIDYRKYTNPTWLKNPRNLLRLTVSLALIGGLIAFLALQGKIVDALHPVTDWLRRTPGAWAVPIGIMVILSFPPLLGHEVLAIMCGNVWGIWIGFGIVAAGTLLGELVTYYTFRYCCRGRGEKAEQKNLKYALISEVLRDGGIRIATTVRFSAIPGHVATAIFATAGIRIWTFFAAAFLSLPKQFAGVYLGVQTHGEDESKKNSPTTIALKVILILITVSVTIYAMWHVDNKMDEIKARVINERRKARKAKLTAASGSALSIVTSTQEARFAAEASEDPEAGVSTPLIETRAINHTTFEVPLSIVVSAPTDREDAMKYSQTVPPSRSH
ncbi:hypothetical protein C8Q74DRAFT_1196413, partial [Fomes fomentarius]